MRSAVISLVFFASACAATYADGGFFPPEHGVANTSDQRAVIIDHGGSETIVLQTAYEGDSSEFAWVIPVPELISAAQSVGTADPRTFETLDQITAPRRLTWTSSSAACGCAGSGDGARVEDGVTVWETLRVDDYDVAVLSSEQSADLAAWLNTNGYGLPGGHEDTLQYYIDRGSYFVALKIAPSADQSAGDNAGGPPGLGDGGAREMAPITLTFSTSDLVFPMRISRVSTKERVEVLLYVVAPHRATGVNYSTAEVDAPASYGGDDFPAAYNRWFEDAIADAGGRALVVEYAGRLSEWTAGNPPLSDVLGGGDDWFVTRLRTRLSPAQMSEDIVLTAAASDDAFEVIVDDGAVALRGQVAVAMLLVGLVQGALFRTRRARRAAWATALCALMIAIL